MFKLSNSTRFNSFGETSWEDGDSTTSVERNYSYKDIISRARTVSILKVFKYYGLYVNESNNKIICPLKSHRESTASFTYYHKENTYHCFGCKSGSSPVDFVSAMDGINRLKAAYKILSVFKDDLDFIDDDKFSFDSTEKLELMMEFSNTVRDFRQIYSDNKEALLWIENISIIYDDLCLKHDKNKKIDINALRSIVFTLKDQIEYYILCHTL